MKGYLMEFYELLLNILIVWCFPKGCDHIYLQVNKTEINIDTALYRSYQY